MASLGCHQLLPSATVAPSSMVILLFGFALLLMPSDKSWPCKLQASSMFLNGLAPEHLISFVAFVNGKTCLVFHFTFQVLISLLITMPHLQTHTK